jgi:Tol biopolymer transport system component
MMEGEALRGAWSPDRLWVAFETSRDGNGEIYRARPDGQAPENLTADPAADQAPSYSPDSRRIAFTSTRGGGASAVWIMDADGGDPRPLSAPVPSGAQGWPAWSPDGRRLALTVHTGAADRVYVASVDGGSAADVATGARPAWSPDGRDLYYDRSDSIFVRAADGSGEEAFVVGGKAAAPSPDGAWIAFVRGDRTTASLHLLDLQRSVETRITR